MSELRRARLNHNPPLSVEDLAKLADLDPKGIRNIESGRTPTPRTETLRKLAVALGVSPVDIDPVLTKSAA